MVYCDLKEVKDGSAVYYFGTSTDNITGLVAFFKEYKKPELIKHPENMTVSETVLFPLVAKYKSKFSQEVFPPKICYEY